jgi:hypothetical protein
MQELSAYPDITVFAAGSFARLEASKHSDIDLFFFRGNGAVQVSHPRTKEITIFGKIVTEFKEMGFADFSNDAEYLVILNTKEMLACLGSPKDDHHNYFTARMLMLLESHCLYGQETYDAVILQVLESYFRDYHVHNQSFTATFLMNDICRFWKTLLLNYENKRNETAIEGGRVKQKVRNFKLKYSRLTTCHATTAALMSHRTPVKIENLQAMIALTPHERLLDIVKRVPEAQGIVQKIIEEYAWFLEMTEKTKEDLESVFTDKTRTTEIFQRADKYHDMMYELLQCVDNTSNLLRLMVI